MPERAPARSIYILLLLFLINLMNFFDRTIRLWCWNLSARNSVLTTPPSVFWAHPSP